MYFKGPWQSHMKKISKALDMTLKKTFLFLLMFMSILTRTGHAASESRSNSRNAPSRSESRNSARPESRNSARPESRTGPYRSSTPYTRGLRSPLHWNMNRARTPTQNCNNSRPKTPIQRSSSNQVLPNISEVNSRPQSPEIRNNDKTEMETKLILVSASIFTIIFVLVLLIIGHFTWFADIRKELEEEWQEELRKEEEKRIAKSILSEMVNPFTNLEDEADEVEGDEATYQAAAMIRRRESSLDSNGCTRGLCFPPHHSILCPNNPNIPSLNEPVPLGTAAATAPFYSEDPIEFRSNNLRKSTEWMNLDSCVRVPEPVPIRDRMRSSSFYPNIPLSTSPPKRPMTPITPDPATMDIDERGRDPEAAKFTESLDLKASPQLNFDLTKLDLI